MYRRYPTGNSIEQSIEKRNQEKRAEEKKTEQKCAEKKHQKKMTITDFIPKTIYNPENKKILGLFMADDLLIIAIILLLIDSEDEENNMLIYALIYILFSDYFDISF